MSKEFWDAQFGGKEYRYGTTPNAFLAQKAPSLIAPGARVVCLGEGEGRNAVWLAEQGFDVTAVDQSSEGLAKLARLAAQRGVKVRIVNARVEDFHERDFDAVILIYLHTPPNVRKTIHAHAAAMLAPDGVLILEGFTPEQRTLNRTSGGPQDIAMLFTEPMLRDDFAVLDIESLANLEIELDEGPGHRGLANVIRVVARKM